MFDCNLIKSKALKIQENQIPYLQVPAPGMAPSMPNIPSVPSMPSIPSMPGMPHPTTPRPPSQRPPLPTAPTTPTVPTVPRPPAAPMFPTIPATPTTPSPLLPPALPQQEQEFAPSLTPLLPRIFPSTTPTISVPINPLLPPEIATTLDYESLLYMNGYLRTQIGTYVQADFLVGSTNIQRVIGKLIGVGLNYILIQDLQTNDITACDFYNLKFLKTFTRELPENIKNRLF